MSYASRDHRQLDRAAAEAQARDGGERGVDGSSSVRSRDRARDARSLGQGNCRVLLSSLSVRTSAQGRQYLSGYIGKAAVVAFQGEPDKFGNPTWDLFLSTPRARE